MSRVYCCTNHVHQYQNISRDLWIILVDTNLHESVFWNSCKITINDNGMSKHNIYKVETDYKYKILIGQLVSTKPSGGAGGPG